MLPKLIIPGAGKSGTTTLAHILCEHPQTFLPKIKEPGFFSTIPEYGQYHLGMRWYESLFDEARNTDLCFEASTIYMYDPESPRLIAQHLDNVKMVFILRDPVARAYSNYWQDRKCGRNLPEFSKMIKAVEFNNFKSYRYDLFDNQNRGWAYVYASDYLQHIQRFLDHFHRDRLLFILFEDFIDNTSSTMDVICRFVGIEPIEVQQAAIKNKSGLPRSRLFQQIIRNRSWRRTLVMRFPWLETLGQHLQKINTKNYIYPHIDSFSKDMLTTFFSERNKELASLLGIDLSKWG